MADRIINNGDGTYSFVTSIEQTETTSPEILQSQIDSFEQSKLRIQAQIDDLTNKLQRILDQE